MRDIAFEVYESQLLREKYYKYTHPSGLDIYVFPKNLSSTYAVFATRYGSLDNSFGIKGEDNIISVPDGIAHFLEHKLFANEDGSDAFEHFSAIGADANAYTSFNKTAYLFSCTENFEEALGELIDFVSHPYFTEESVNKERGIIAQEIKMYDDSPPEVCYYGMLEGLYEKHSVKKNICGSCRSISEITPELLYECYRVFYSLSNMALIVCGDIDAEQVIAVADAHLPSENRGVEIVRVSENALEKAEVAHRRIEKKMKVSKPIFNIGIKDVNIPSDTVDRLRKDAAVSILDEMLFARAGELYSELFESGLVSPGMSYGYTLNPSFAFNSIAGEADDPEAVLKRIMEYLSEVANRGLAREDFERGKRVMYAEFVKAFDSTEEIANNTLSFVFEGADIFRYADIISEVSFEDVESLFKEMFKEEFFTMSVVRPLDSDT